MITFILFHLMTFSAQANTALIPSLAPYKAIPMPGSSIPLPDSFADVGDYQIGAEWGKKQVKVRDLSMQSASFQRAALATVYIPSGGTGFYLGKFGESHVIATNHHVCPNGVACLNQKADFRLLEKKYKMVKLFETFNDIDLTLLEIQVPASDEALLAQVAGNFAFKKDLKHKQPLVTIGFGVAGNPFNQLMANQDSDCVVLSADKEYRHMKDPDDLNPGEDTVWSFANGCDVSHGDSGSAMVDRMTSEVMGIIWTGRIPKNPMVQSDQYMMNVQADSFHADVWKEFSYAVPAIKMVDYILKAAQTTSDTKTQTVLLKLIDTK